MFSKTQSSVSLENIFKSIKFGIYPESPFTIYAENFYDFSNLKVSHFGIDDNFLSPALQLKSFPADFHIVFDFINIHECIADNHAKDILKALRTVKDSKNCPINFSVELKNCVITDPETQKKITTTIKNIMMVTEEIRIIATEKLCSSLFEPLDRVKIPEVLIINVAGYLVEEFKYLQRHSAETVINDAFEKVKSIKLKQGMALLGFFPTPTAMRPDRLQLINLLTQNLKHQFEGISKVRVGIDALRIDLVDNVSAKKLNDIIKDTNISSILENDCITIKGKNIQKFMDAYGKIAATLFFPEKQLKSSCSIS